MTHDDDQFESRSERVERIQLENLEAEKPILADLREVGVAISTVWAIKSETSAHEYPRSIPVLMKYVVREDLPDNLRNAVAQALAVPEASGEWERIVEIYEATVPGIAKDGLAVAVGRGFNKARADRALELVRDPAGGMSRVLLIRPLKRIRDDRILPFLESLRSDEQLGEEVRRALAGRSVNS